MSICRGFVSEWSRFLSWWSRSRLIANTTKTHALNLAKYVATYKAIMLLQKRVNLGIPRTLDTFIAGLVGGYVVFGERTPVNEQVCLNMSAPWSTYSCMFSRRSCCTSARA